MIWLWWWMGCTSPEFVLQSPSCDADYLERAGGLTYDVFRGTGDGTFDYAPEDSEIVVEVEGAYDLRRGDFERTRRYAEGGYRVADRATGAGTLWPDGDLDLGYTLEAELADRTEQVEVRDVRLGCGVERRVEDAAGRVDVYEGTLRDNRLAYTHELVEGAQRLVAEGLRSRDGTWSETLDHASDGLVYQLDESGDLTDGSWRRDIRYETDDAAVDGVVRRRPNGRLTVDYTARVGRNVPENWSYVLDARGDGTGTLEFEGNPEDCTVVIEAGRCSITDCRAAGPCTPPLATDEVLLRL